MESRHHKEKVLKAHGKLKRHLEVYNTYLEESLISEEDLASFGGCLMLMLM